MQANLKTIADVRLPTFWFSQNLVGVANTMESITVCRKLGWKKGFYKNLVLVDSQGMRFDVIDAQKVDRLPFRFTFADFLELLGGNPRWEVELLFAAPARPIPFQEVKALIHTSFRKEKYHWEAMIDFEEFRDQVTAATSLSQLFTIFTSFNRA